jgi:hypothetical protein
MQKWEYKTAKLDTKGWFIGGILDTQTFDQLLNNMGRDGWELVSAFDTNQAYGASREAVAVFKRPVN